jgi:hypothetical protein
MAFLFQDQNQGTRQNDSPREDAREIATVLFHPDFNRRLRLRTESADPLSPKLSRAKALAGLGVVKDPYRRWGISPRPENIKPPDMGDLRKLCRVGSSPTSGFGAEIGMPRRPGPRGSAPDAARRMATTPGRQRSSSLRRIEKANLKSSACGRRRRSGLVTRGGPGWTAGCGSRELSCSAFREN